MPTLETPLGFLITAETAGAVEAVVDMEQVAVAAVEAANTIIERLHKLFRA
jgi:hypothetical protein